MDTANVAKKIVDLKIITTRVSNAASIRTAEEDVVTFRNGALIFPCDKETELEVLEVQVPGKKVVDTTSFWNGLKGLKLQKLIILVAIDESWCIEINTTNATTFSTPLLLRQTGENTIHNLGLRYTPGGSEEWNRMVENGFKPALGLMFVKLEEAIEFYNLYAVACGFIPRKYTQTRFRDGLIDKKSMVCNRHGFKEDRKKLKPVVEFENTEEKKRGKGLREPKKTKITRFGCKAKIRFCAVFNDLKELIGYAIDTFYEGHNHKLCSLKEREFQKNALSQSQDGFYYAYQVDEDNCLAKLFWADAQARMNYSLFGDTITFDPTYGTNKYRMAFTPFTGVDNHKKSVTFAAALVDHENDGSFIWVLKKFLDCMGNKEPQCILTDQDPAIKLGVRSVFKQARHRYCMWHIMKKLTDKVESQICKETDFVERICGVVWDTDLEPIEFEEKWTQVINDFELNDNTWLTYMYGKRHKWIPAYFRDLPLGCLLKTTQRSESQNSYFKRFESIDGTLVEFWLRFQSAMEQQRYNHRFLDAASDSTLPQVSSKTMIEKHASKIYTHTVFYEFQEQVQMAPCSCAVVGFSEQGNMHIINVEDAYRKHRVFQEKDSKHTEQDIETRWTKKSYRKPLYGLDGKLLQDYDPTDLRKLELSRVWSEFYATISVLNSMPDNQIKELSLMLLQFREKINPTKESLTKDQELEMLLGCSAKSNITVLPPKIAKNKGSGMRMKSNKDKAIEKASKPKRLCNNCKQMGHHDKRNCPNPD
ncbi:protein FAR1-RELATED SEQUENCE 5-like [Silene latifolia]|uniref:protein FAR1-RELATED SEQUENCE 5-like n=1 Tax=Silene latifolia TaxID=37657 RepID=UPI003D7764C9